MLIVMQLFIASFLLVLLDEAMEKGHGIGSGVSLFMCCHICADVLWKALCPFMVTTSTGSHFIGVLVAVPHILITRRNKLRALVEVFFRQEGLCNLSGLVSTSLVFLVAVYFCNWRVDLALKNDKQRGSSGSGERYSIKLLYTSSMPVMLYSAFIGNYLFISQVLFVSYPKHAFIKMIGMWREHADRQLYPTSGLAYLVSPPKDLDAALSCPLQVVIYIASVLTACCVFSQVHLVKNIHFVSRFLSISLP